MIRRRLIPLGLGLLVTLAVMALYTVGTPFFDLIEMKALDAMFIFRGSVPQASDRVALVNVSEQSLDKFGRWPWPRNRIADLIRAVSGYGAKSIGLDMGFFEPDNRFDAETIIALTEAFQAGQPMSLEEVATRFHPDYLLAQALAEVKAKVTLGFFFHMTRDQLSHVASKEIRARRRQMNKFALPAVRYVSEAAMDRPLITAYAPETNQPILTEVAKSAGYFNVLPDGDGVTRRAALVIQCGGRLFPALGLATLAGLLDAPLPIVTVEEFGLEKIKLGPVTIPVDELGRAWINFRGGQGTVKSYEAADLLEGKLEPGALKGKAVIIGVTATGLFDVRATPFETTQPGAEIQATVMDNILSGQFLFRPTWARIFDLAAMLLMGLLAAGLFIYLPPSRAWWLAIAQGLAAVGGGYLIFLQGYIINLPYPIAAMLATAVALTVYRYLTEEREKTFIRHAFQHYLNPDIIEEVVNQPEGLQLGGQKKELTVLFSDIRGFTSISEQVAPEVLSQGLNTYLDRMTEIVFERDGVLDKYIGDAVMAFYGAPAERPDHARLACLTALDMQAALRELQPQLKKMGMPELKIGIGVNTGPMIVGNLGSRLRFDYTVIGDEVNLGSRLESQTKAYLVDIIAGETTEAACRADFYFRVLDLIRVKGKKQPVTIYQLIGPAEGPRPPVLDLAREAFNLYLARDFETSLSIWEKIMVLIPNDGPAAMLAERCRHLIADPPPPDWDGVETKKSK